MNIPIIFEDEYLAVVDKPAGIVVNRSEKAAGETVQDWAEEKFRIQNSRLRPTYAKASAGKRGFGGQAEFRMKKIFITGRG